MTYECAPSCGFTFDDVGEYLRHVAVRAKKKRQRTALEQKLPFPT